MFNLTTLLTFGLIQTTKACCSGPKQLLFESHLTWDDRALNAKSSAVLSELDELLHVIEQLSDDHLCACFNLHTQQYHHTKHLHSMDSLCPAANSRCFDIAAP